MGTRFANFYIRNIDPAVVQGMMPHCIVREISKGWTMVMHEDFQIGQIEREARKLSKRIVHSILSVGYYDGDILVVGVFNQGKSVALHVSNNGYGYEAKMGNPRSFQRFLELNEGDAPLLKEIFKCEDIEKKINLLEHLLEVPIWLNSDSFARSNEESGQFEINKSIIHDYINETKAASKINNKTKLRMKAEIEGMPELHLFKLPNVNGNFMMNDPNTYEFQTDGSLIPKKIEHNIASDRQTPVHLFLSLPDGAVIYSSYGLDPTIFEYGVDGDIKWELKVGHPKVPPILHNNFIYMVIGNNESTIIKLNRDGLIEANYPINTLGSCHWKRFLFDKFNRMYFCCTLRNDGNPITKLYCFDEKLKKLAELDIEGTSYDSLIDNESSIIYLYIFDKEIVRVDLNTMQICKRKKCTEYIELMFIDLEQNIFIKKGESTLEVMNPDLDVISRHKLKGQIQKSYINQEGIPCFLTWNGERWDSGEEKSTIRLFEVFY